MGTCREKIISTSPMNILYQLTDKGDALASALVPMEKWAQEYIELESE